MRYSLDRGVDTRRESAQRLFIVGLPILLALAVALSGPQSFYNPNGNSAGDSHRTPMNIYTVNIPKAANKSTSDPALSVNGQPAQPSQTTPFTSSASSSTAPAAPTSSPSVADSGGSSPSASQSGTTSSGSQSGPLSLTYTISMPAQLLPTQSTPLIKTSGTSLTIN